MCGRYTLTRYEGVVEDLQAALGVSAQGEWWKPRFNVAPTQPAPVVTVKDGTRLVELMKWGLVPHWAARERTPTGASPAKRPPLMINARVETLTEKPAFRDALARRRCLVPADGFYEWRRDLGATPQPIYFHPGTPRLFAFAGLWARNRTDQGEHLTFTIITGSPNELVAPIHDRMPVILPPSAYAAWLDPSLGIDAARALLTTPPVDDWTAQPVSTWVNKADHDDPRCLEPATAPAPTQTSLF